MSVRIVTPETQAIVEALNLKVDNLVSVAQVPFEDLLVGDYVLSFRGRIGQIQTLESKEKNWRGDYLEIKWEQSCHSKLYHSGADRMVHVRCSQNGQQAVDLLANRTTAILQMPEPFKRYHY